MMYRTLLNIVWLVAAISFCYAQNDYPIVLIHGFIGWGPEEMGDYNYWGGNMDIQEELEAAGNTVYNLSVGPVSSNWERAVEAYYQIKGGQVDYGVKHAEKWGIVRQPAGKEYVGLYPQWDADHPVHIIGHSMGGQTARMLLYQLNEIFMLDSAGITPEPSDLLGEAHPGYIASITTIATPHNGTTLSNIVTRSIPFLQYFVGVAAVIGNKFYSFDLEQWGFKRYPNENWMAYYKRMREHPAWSTKNISAWDLSINGARELNTFLQADPSVYYFSFSTSATHLDTSTGYYIPDNSMNLILKARARIIGRDVAFWDDGSQTDYTWFENDGVVNTISMRGPTTGLNGPDPIAEYRPSEPLLPGVWYTFPIIKLDHWAIIGHLAKTEEEKQMVKDLFLHQAERLHSLPIFH